MAARSRQAIYVAGRTKNWDGERLPSLIQMHKMARERGRELGANAVVRQGIDDVWPLAPSRDGRLC